MKDITGKELKDGDFILITEGTQKLRGFVFLVKNLGYLSICAEGLNYMSVDALSRRNCSVEILPEPIYNPEPIRRYLEKIREYPLFDGELCLDRMMIILSPEDRSNVVLGVAFTVEEAKKIIRREVKSILAEAEYNAGKILNIE